MSGLPRPGLAACMLVPTLVVGCTTGTDAGPAIPPFDADADVRFVLGPSYAAGADVLVRIEDRGSVAYLYRALWPACAVGFFADDGRAFRIPTGVTCEEGGDDDIVPGETVILFQWGLTQCTATGPDGCTASEPLGPGRYHLRATFRSVDGLQEASTGASFMVTE